MAHARAARRSEDSGAAIDSNDCRSALTPRNASTKGWIATRLTMRSAANVSQQIRRFQANLNSQSDPRIQGRSKLSDLLTEPNGAKITMVWDSMSAEGATG